MAFCVDYVYSVYSDYGYGAGSFLPVPRPGRFATRVRLGGGDLKRRPDPRTAVRAKTPGAPAARPPGIL